MSANEVGQEIGRLKVALRAAVTASKARQQSLSVKLGAGVAEILGAQGGFFDDPILVGNIESLIRANLYSAEYAVSRSIRSLVMPLSQLNLITGANGSGKSSLYRALRLLAEAAQGGIVSSRCRGRRCVPGRAR